MAYNGAGVFTRLYNWVVENASPPIEIAKLDTQEEDFATALSNCLLRDGTGLPTAAIPWNSQNLTGVATLTAVTGTFSGTVSAVTGTISGNATISGTLGVTGVITGVGSGITALNASNLASGTVPDARFPATLPAASGVNLTALNGTNIASGTVADARLSSNVPLKNGANTFTAAQIVQAANGAVSVNATSTAGTATVTLGNTADAITDGISLGFSGSASGFVAGQGYFHFTGGLGFYNTAYTRKGFVGNTTGWVIDAPGSGVALAVSGVSGTHSATIADSAGTTGFNVGYLNIPQNAQTANYTLVLADAGKHIYHASGAGSGDTYTIPANGSVAYPIGTAITFVNADSNSVSIAITTDTLTLAGTTTSGTRTLAQNGVATAIKHTSTAWIISGSGIT